MSTEGGVDMHRGRRRYEGGGDIFVSSLKKGYLARLSCLHGACVSGTG